MPSAHSLSCVAASSNSRRNIVGSKSQNSFRETRFFPKSYSVEGKNKILNKSKNDEIENKNQNKTVIKNYEDKNDKNQNILQTTQEIIEYGKKKLKKENFLVKKFFDKKKQYFISHPKINYIKYGTDWLGMKTWKISDILEPLPKTISRLRFSSKSQKNALIVFPSSLNQTVVNLEKLRVNKNFRSMEVKFEENRKINKI